jgi:hypothetical protein
MTGEGRVVEFAAACTQRAALPGPTPLRSPNEPRTAIAADVLAAAQVHWDYHDLHHQLRPTDVGIGLGSHDLGVAIYTAELYRAGLVPLVVFTGANAPTTIERFPRGEAIHYAERAQRLGGPADAILVEPKATNTAENLTLARKALADNGVTPPAVTVISRPDQQRRAYASCRKLWPEVDIICTSRPLPLTDCTRASRCRNSSKRRLRPGGRAARPGHRLGRGGRACRG